MFLNRLARGCLLQPNGATVSSSSSSGAAQRMIAAAVTAYRSCSSHAHGSSPHHPSHHHAQPAAGHQPDHAVSASATSSVAAAAAVSPAASQAAPQRASLHSSATADSAWESPLRQVLIRPRFQSPVAQSETKAESLFQKPVDLYTRLLDNNRQWAGQVSSVDPNYFPNLARGQQPPYMYIGCSDSRVPPDQLTQTMPGELFIHRNVANLVVNTDMNLMAVLQYAVEVLKVQHIIVMGHTECGGVRASMTSTPHGIIDEWLRNIKDVYRLHRQELEAISDMSARVNRLVELNVVEQVYNLYKTSVVQKSWAQGHRVQVLMSREVLCLFDCFFLGFLLFPLVSRNSNSISLWSSCRCMAGSAISPLV
ncbi:carbonate dehydratase, variant 1 [Capsaspora owczarzaki ATCC 30864]|uniref:Carbonic anhydrase n=1 Tax=Capsaspora owczarzaki (strain ATCC 30864) TaxID=595528 RepID=A0A0D2X1S9_CAPO3|nr:carbonate dehydratase, variant 1 [Capsaspora owczarzaki ATCC 30864]